MTKMNETNTDYLNNFRIPAVREFLQTAVIIDDDISFLQTGAPSDPISRKTATRATSPEEAAFGAGGVIETVTISERKELDGGTPIQANWIDQLVEEALRQGIFCTPVSHRSQGDIGKIRNVAESADLVILDWTLSRDNGEQGGMETRNFVCELLKKDVLIGGRSRLLCIYTNEDVGNVTKDLKDSLDEKLSYLKPSIENLTIPDSAEHVLKVSHGIIVLLSKKSVSVSELPNTLVRHFATLINGMMPTIAIGAISSIRRSVHQLLTVFSRDLDCGMNGHRLMIPFREDFAPFVLNLLADELRTVIQTSGAVDKYGGGKSAFLSWLSERSTFSDATGTSRDRSFVEMIYDFKGSDPRKYGDELKDLVCQSGVSKNKFHQWMRDIPRLFASSDQEKDTSCALVSELVQTECTRCRKAIGDPEWVPTLSLGTVIKEAGENAQGHTFLCIQPRCDSVRLQIEESTTFVFLKVMRVENDDRFSLLVGNEKYRIISNPGKLEIFEFKPDVGGNAIKATKEENEWTFSTSTKRRFLWIGNLRPMLAQKIVADLLSSFGRVGIDDFEWARLRSNHGMHE